MKRINANFIIKNMTGIICAVIIVCFLLPFISVDASMSVMGASKSNSTVINGFKALTDGGFLGLLLLIDPLLILIANYIPQISKYKKIITLVLSAINIIVLFTVPGQVSIPGNSGNTSMKVTINYQIGFWLMLAFSVVVVILSVIQFFNLSGNMIFDTLNTSEESSTDKSSTGNISNHKINISKITDMAKNATTTVSQQAKNIADNVSVATQNFTQSHTSDEIDKDQSNIKLTSQQTNPNVSEQNHSQKIQYQVNQTYKNESPEEIM